MTDRIGTARRASGEFVLIIVGVLAAIGLESWWSERAELRQDRAHFAAMADEFETTLAVLNFTIGNQRESADRMRRLQELLRSGRSDLRTDSVLLLGQNLWMFNGLRDAGPAYEQFMASGRLPDLRNLELAYALRAYETMRAGVLESDDYLRQSSIMSWEPVLAERIPFIPYRGTPADTVWALEAMTPPAALANDLELMNLLSIRLMLAEAGITTRELLVEAADDALLRLREELETEN